MLELWNDVLGGTCSVTSATDIGHDRAWPSICFFHLDISLFYVFYAFFAVKILNPSGNFSTNFRISSRTRR